MQNTILRSNSRQLNDVPLVNINDYDALQERTRCSFARAFQATDRKTEKCVFIAVFEDPNGDMGYDKFFDRLLSISSVGVSGAIQFLGYKLPVSENEKNLLSSKASGFIVTEFIQNGSLEDHLRNFHKRIDKGQLNSTRRTKIIFGIAAIMKKLHSHKIIHRNLKPSQILLNENFEPLIDYSYLSKIITGPYDMTMCLGSPLFMAPELFDDDYETYGFPVDVYAYSMILYLMFVENVKLDSERPIRSPQLYLLHIHRGFKPKWYSCIPDCYWELIQRCWKSRPEERPTFAEITEILKDDQYVLHDCGEPDLNEIHRYQNEIDN